MEICLDMKCIENRNVPENFWTNRGARPDESPGSSHIPAATSNHGWTQTRNRWHPARSVSKEIFGPLLEICLSYLKMIGLLLNLVVCHRFPYSNGKFGGLSY
jgi:hypothetical protein